MAVDRNSARSSSRLKSAAFRPQGVAWKGSLAVIFLGLIWTDNPYIGYYTFSVRDQLRELVEYGGDRTICSIEAVLEQAYPEPQLAYARNCTLGKETQSAKGHGCMDVYI